MIYFQHARIKFALFFDMICNIWAQGKVFKLNIFQRIFWYLRVILTSESIQKPQLESFILSILLQNKQAPTGHGSDSIPSKCPPASLLVTCLSPRLLACLLACLPQNLHRLLRMLQKLFQTHSEHNVPDTHTHDNLTPQAPVGAKNEIGRELVCFSTFPKQVFFLVLYAHYDS